MVLKVKEELVLKVKEELVLKVKEDLVLKVTGELVLKVKEIGWRQLHQSSVRRNLFQATPPKRKFVKSLSHTGCITAASQ